MRLAQCIFEGEVYVAIGRDGTGVIDLLALGTDLLQCAADPAAAELAITRRGISEDAVRFLPPISRPDKTICVGVNYAAHAAEAANPNPPPAHPSLFVRFPSSQVGHNQPIIAPSISTEFDFEGELAVIIGKRAWRTPRESALDHVAGYSCFAENSVRDFQRHAAQVTAGKNFRGSGAFGPWLTTRDEVGDPASLTLTTRLNGTVMQHEPISSLIFPVDVLIAYISQFTELLPGDVIATGTPAGVGALRKPPVWMKEGDVLEIDITRVGLLRNVVAAEK